MYKAKPEFSVIALNDNEELTTKTMNDFAHWFSNKFIGHYSIWCTLNKERLMGDTSASTSATLDDDKCYI